MQQVPARRRLSEQMMIVELVQLAPGILQARVVQRGGRVRVDVWSQREAEPPEQPLLIRREVLIGQIERRRYGQVLRAHDRQPIARSGQLGRELGGSPGRVMPEPPGKHPDRQRQEPAQPGDLPAGGLVQFKVGPASEPDEQRPRLIGRQGVDADHDGVLERGQPPSAGDQHQAGGAAGQQRPHLLVPGNVVEEQQNFLARDVVSPLRRPRFQARRDMLNGHPRRHQQTRQGIGRVDG